MSAGALSPDAAVPAPADAPARPPAGRAPAGAEGGGVGMRALFADPLLKRALLAGWLFFAAATAWQRRAVGPPFGQWDHVAFRVLGESLFLAALCWASLALPRRFPLEDLRGRRRLAAAAAAMLGVAVAASAAHYGLLCFVYARRCNRTWPLVMEAVAPNLHLVAVMVAVGYGVQYARRHRAHEIAASRLAAQLSDARLAALKAQLHPHFLFNTFHSVIALMHSDVAAAEAMLGRLTSLLRLTLERAGQQEVTLAEELAFLEMYTGIEKARFSDRLRLEVRYDPAVRQARVPHLLLQPLVENAIRHGIAVRPGPGRIEVSAQASGGRLVLRVADQGPGSDAAAANGNGNGVGLANTRERLAQLYGAEHSFVLRRNAEGGTTVTVAIPLRLTPLP